MVRPKPLKVLPAEVTEGDRAALASYIADMPAGYAVPDWASGPVSLVALLGEDPESSYAIRVICDAYPPAVDSEGYVYVFCVPALVASMLAWYGDGVTASYEVPFAFQGLFARAGWSVLAELAAQVEDPDKLGVYADEMITELSHLLGDDAQAAAVLRVCAEFDAPAGMTIREVVETAKLIVATQAAS